MDVFHYGGAASRSIRFSDERLCAQLFEQADQELTVIRTVCHENKTASSRGLVVSQFKFQKYPARLPIYQASGTRIASTTALVPNNIG